MQKKGKKEVKKEKKIQFSNLEPKFCQSLDLDLSNKKFAFKFEFCAKKSAEIKKQEKKDAKKKSFA